MTDLHTAVSTRDFDPATFRAEQQLTSEFWEDVCSATVLVPPNSPGTFLSGTMDFIDELRDALPNQRIELLAEYDKSAHEYALHDDSITLPALFIFMGVNGIPASVFANYLWEWVRSHWGQLSYGKARLKMELHVAVEEKFGHRQSITVLNLDGPAGSYRPESVLENLPHSIKSPGGG